MNMMDDDWTGWLCTVCMNLVDNPNGHIDKHPAGNPDDVREVTVKEDDGFLWAEPPALGHPTPCVYLDVGDYYACTQCEALKVPPEVVGYEPPTQTDETD